MSDGEIFVGSVAVGIVPSAQGFAERIRQQVVPSANSAGDEWGDIFASRIREKMRGALQATGAARINVTADTSKARAEIDALSRDAGNSGDRAGDSFGARFVSRVSSNLRGRNLFGGSDDSAAQSGDKAAKSFASSFINSSVFGKKGAIVTGVVSAMALLPELGAVAGVGIVGALGVAIAASIPSVQKQFKAFGVSVLGTLQETVKPLIPFITSTLGQLAGWIKSIAPQLTDLFKNVGPLLTPLIRGFEQLVSGLLPGLNSLLQVARPAMDAFGEALGIIGRNVGAMFKAIGPALAASAKVFVVLMDVVSSLLPVIVKLAGIFAAALAPVLLAILGVFKDLEPIILKVAGIFGQFAGAVLKSLSGTLSLLAGIIKSIIPGIVVFGNALAQVFKVLENSGVFFVLENAIIAVAKPLAQVVNSLLKGLAPILPKVIDLFAQFVAVLAGQVSVILLAFLKIILALIPAFITLTTWVVKIMTGALKPLIPIIAGLTIAWFALNLVLDANPWVLLGLAILAIILVVIKFHNDIIHWILDAVNEVKHIWDVAWTWIMNFFKAWWPVLIGVAFGALGILIGLIVKYHTDIKNFIVSVWNSILNFFKAIGNAIAQFWDNLWHGVYNLLASIWRAIDKIIGDALNWILGTARSILGTVSNIWSNAWNGIRNVTGTLLGYITNGFKSFWGGLTKGFQDAVNTVQRIWGTIEQIAKKPVAFIVDQVYNAGIVKVVDAIAGVFGLHPLQPIAGFAQGTGGAPPGWAWVGEEGPELVNMRGGEQVLNNRQSMATGLWGHGRGFATGTSPVAGGTGKASHGNPRAINTKLLPDGNPVTQLAEGALHLGEKALTGLRDLAGDAMAAGLNAILNPLINAIPGIDTGFGKYVKRDITFVEQKLVDYIKGVSQPSGGSGNAGAIASYAESFNGHKYVFGGPSNPQGGWDCSSFVSYVLGHFNMDIPGGSWKKITNNGASHGPVASQYKSWSGAKNKGSQNPNNIAAGDLLTWDTHVGFGAGKNRMFSAYSTNSGTIYTPATAGPTGEQLLIRTINAAQGGGPAGGATGSEMANGRELFGYLLNNVFGGHKIAAAGAIASIWGESSWNPFASGTGGRGLIGWTPAGSISNADFSGGMRTQEPAIVRFIQTSGDEGVIRSMMGATSVLQAANLWGHGVERFGINDVHSTGLSLATSIMNSYAVGTRGAAPGWAWVGELGPELVRMSGGETVLTHEQSMSALSRNPGRGYWAGTTGTSPMDSDSSQFSSGGGGNGIERKLDDLIKATKNVGGDVANGLNVPGRVAGNRSNFNNRR